MLPMQATTELACLVRHVEYEMACLADGTPDRERVHAAYLTPGRR